MAPERFDAIVVGSGATGGWTAKELTERGLTVLLLEAGRAIRPEVDFPLPAPPERRLATRLTRGIVRQPMQMRCAPYDARSCRFFVDDRANPYATPAGQPFNWFRGRQVGGRLHVWARVAVRASALELDGASDDGSNAWPLSYDELAPYYERVERFLEVEGCADGVPSLPDGAYAGTACLTPAEEAFKRAVERAFPDRRVVAARVVRHDRERLPRALRAAQASGRLVVRSDAVVRRVTVDEASGLATGVVFVDRSGGEPGEARGRAVVLCASTIETLRLLLHSKDARHPRGLGNASGRLGQGIVDHVMIAAAGPAAPGVVAQSDGADADADPYDFGRATGFLVPRFRNVTAPHPAFRRGYMVQGGIGRGAGWYMLAHGEMLARPENRVVLDEQRRDAWGVPAARIACTWSDNEEAMLADASAQMHAMAAAAGLEVRAPGAGRLLDALAVRLWRSRLFAPSGAFLPGSAAHEAGGAAMGSDAATSVCDRFGALWDAPNVVVADGAAFPAGCCQNVTLTLMALAARAAEQLALRLRSG